MPEQPLDSETVTDVSLIGPSSLSMRVIYCDPALVSFAGHFGSHCSALTRGLTAAGAEVVVLGSAGLTAEVKSRFHALPTFTVSPYLSTSADPLCGSIKSYLDVSSRICSDLCRVKGITRQDLVYFDAPTPAALRGLCLWLESLGEEAPRCVVNLIEQTGLLPHEQADGTTELRAVNAQPMLYRLAAVSIAEAVRLLIRFVSIEPVYASLYSRLLEMPVDRVPHPFGPTNRERAARGRGALTIGFIGAQQPIKGFALVPDIVRYILRDVPEAHVLVHDSFGGMAKELTELQDIERQDSRLRVIRSAVTPEAYEEILDECDMLVAPYSRSHYSIASSGIANECLANGIPLIATAGTTPARDLAEYGLESLCVTSHSAEGFGEAIRTAIATWPVVIEKTAAASRDWTQRNGPLQAARAILSLDFPACRPVAANS